MALDFNIEPFFDDYSEDKKFYRILFRPGYAVQARELTQLQTILQEQIKRHGDHIFKEGAMIIPGQVSYDLDINYICIASEIDGSVNYKSIFDALVGRVIRNSAGVTAKVVAYDLAAIDRPNTLFIKYISGGTSSVVFSETEVVSTIDESISLTIDTNLSVNQYLIDTAVGNSSLASISRGVFYIKNNFVLVTEQQIILDAYGNKPSYRIGLEATESIIYPEQDESLLDNALGSPNYAAPGAARYSIDLTLSKKELDSADDENFIDLLRLRDGKLIFKLDKTLYAELEKTMARRTFDESGDYTVTPFKIGTHEFRNNYRGAWRAGKVYLQGDVIASDTSIPNRKNYWVCTSTGTNGVSGSVSPASWSTSSAFITDGQLTWEYTLVPSFNRGINNFTTNDSDLGFTIDDHKRLASMVSYSIDAGKAYVKGYEIEKISTQYVDSFKSREMPEGSAALCSYFGVEAGSLPALDASTYSTTETVDVSMGSYVIASGLKYAPDLQNYTPVNLYKDNTNIIGKARVRGIEYHESNAESLAGTYAVGAADSPAGGVDERTICTITSTAHGLVTGDSINLTFTATSGTVPSNGNYIITVTGVNTFTVTLSGILSAGSVGSIAAAFNRNYYKVFLFDINVTAPNTFDKVKKIYTTSTSFTCNVKQEGTTPKAVLYNPDKTSLVYPLKNQWVRQLTSIEYTSSYTISLSISGDIAYNAVSGENVLAPTNFIFESADLKNNYIIINTVSGEVISDRSSGNSYTLNRPVLTLANNNNTLVIKNIASGSYTLIATISTQNAVPISSFVENVSIPTDKVKTFVTAASQTATNELYLDHANVSRIVSVMLRVNNGVPSYTTGTYTQNITNRYVLYKNEYSSHQQTSYIKLSPYETLPGGSIQVTYEVIESSSPATQKFRCVNSYSNSTISYETIPSVATTPLRDCLDFRPYTTNQSTGVMYGRLMPKFGSVTTVTYDFYTPRLDTISLSAMGEFIVTPGLPAVSPVESRAPDNSMKLAVLALEAYTVSAKDNIAINMVENKRYTMRDIGRLERRIQDLEYYTSLSLVESETKAMSIVDSNGLDRYKNGFLVDSFDGQGVGDVSSDDWNASIDTENKELRPFFSQRQLEFTDYQIQRSVAGYQVTGDCITLPMTNSNVVLIQQLKASENISVNPYDLFSFIGFVELNPFGDSWFETKRRPDIILNDESQYVAIASKAERDGVLGTLWNAWITVLTGSRNLGTSRLSLRKSAFTGGSITSITGASNFTAEELAALRITDVNLSSGLIRTTSVDVTAIDTTQNRTGTRTTLQSRTDSKVIDDSVVETRIVPYIRPRGVVFTGFGFKPNTTLNAFFDGINVNNYIEGAEVIKVQKITGYSSRFDTLTNCGTNINTTPRKILQAGYGRSTITVTNGSNIVTGDFLRNDIVAGDTIIIDDGIAGNNDEFTVTAIAIEQAGPGSSLDQLTLNRAYQGTTASEIGYKVKVSGSPVEEVEAAFSHGELITDTVTGTTAIVIGQESYTLSNGTEEVFLFVMNIKKPTSASTIWSTASNAVLQGEYSVGGSIPRVKFVQALGKMTMSSYTGQYHGMFRIPNNPLVRFRTGERELMFTSGVSPTDTTAQTSGVSSYIATGIIETYQKTILNTRTADIVASQVQPETRTLVTNRNSITSDTRWYDPLAQTFLIQRDGGAFLTSVDIYFASKHQEIPVRIEIREVVNGYPGSKVLPFSRVQKNPSEVDISATGTVATNFKFRSPVYVADNTEYALVILSDSAAYYVHVAVTGNNQYGGGRISSQPYNGVFFKSQNASTWTADQLTDLKFTIKCAEFDIASSFDVKMLPPKLGLTNLSYNPFMLAQGSNQIRVTHPNHGMINGESVRILTTQVINSINGIPASEIFYWEATTSLTANNKTHVVSCVEEDSYVITVTTPSNISGAATGSISYAGGSFIYASEIYEFSTAMFDSASTNLPGTKLNFKLTSQNHSSTETITDLTVKENVSFNEPQTISYLKSAAFTQIQDVYITASLSSSNKNITPVLDLGRQTLTLVNNKIDELNPLAPSAVSGSGVSVGLDERILLSGVNLLDYANSNIVAVDDQFQNITPPAEFSVSWLKVPVQVNSVANPSYDKFSTLRIGDCLRFLPTSIAAYSYYIVAEKVYETDALYINFALDRSTTTPDILTTTTHEISLLSRYKSEIAPEVGSTCSKYVTKKIVLSRPSEMLKIMFAASIPSVADVDVYYKIGNDADALYDSNRFFLADPTSKYLKSESQFIDLEYNIENLEPFNAVTVKLVMRSSNNAKVPRIKDFRVIACA